jgi:hypothetical protein
VLKVDLVVGLTYREHSLLWHVSPLGLSGKRRVQFSLRGKLKNGI